MWRIYERQWKLEEFYYQIVEQKYEEEEEYLKKKINFCLYNVYHQYNCCNHNKKCLNVGTL